MAKYNRIGYKKFWEILEKSGYHKSIWGYEGIINMLIQFEYNEMRRFKEKDGFECIVEDSRNRAESMYDELNTLGYYDRKEEG